VEPNVRRVRANPDLIATPTKSKRRFDLLGHGVRGAVSDISGGVTWSWGEDVPWTSPRPGAKTRSTDCAERPFANFVKNLKDHTCASRRR
jgi:hypothetical protein